MSAPASMKPSTPLVANELSGAPSGPGTGGAVRSAIRCRGRDPLVSPVNGAPRQCLLSQAHCLGARCHARGFESGAHPPPNTATESRRQLPSRRARTAYLWTRAAIARPKPHIGLGPHHETNNNHRAFRVRAQSWGQEPTIQTAWPPTMASHASPNSVGSSAVGAAPSGTRHSVRTPPSGSCSMGTASAG
jgi:hypothetical protein